MTAPHRTALHAEHKALGAAFTDFGGWDMPLKYGSELAEHRAVREAAGLFDLSHMGEVWVMGAEAATLLNTALVGDLAAMRAGRAKYTLICDDAGGIIDDLIVYRVAGEGREESRYLVVPNAGNAERVAGLLAERGSGFDAVVVDASAETSLIAVQGPAAERIVREIVRDEDRAAVSDLKYYAWAAVRVPVRSDADSAGLVDGSGAGAGAIDAAVSGGADSAGFVGGSGAGAIDVLLARTGYTGEDGFELFVPNERAAELWRLLLAAGGPHGLVPAGLAARDSLRLEAGMPLYGNELSLDTTPVEAGLGAIVSLTKPERFVGRDALEAAAAAGPRRVLVGLAGSGRRAGRGGYTVHAVGVVNGPGGGDTNPEIGRITSGQPSPTLGHPIALAYLEPAFAEPGTAVEVELRGKREPFEVVPLPFYRRPRSA